MKKKIEKGPNGLNFFLKTAASAGDRKMRAKRPQFKV